MKFGLLGRLEVEDQDRAVDVRGAKPRALLAVLLLFRNQPVGLDRLMQALWEGQAPASARQSIQFFVHQLRKVLPQDGQGSVLETHKSGYLLRVGDGELDIERFQEFLVRARRQRADGDPDTAWATFQAALDVWRGSALADFGDAAFAQPEISRLEELRLAATIEQLQLGLELGRHVALIGELEGLVATHPLREQLRALQMTALYRAGRAAEALEAYRAAHDTFVEQLGIEPGPDLRRLRQQILDQDPTLDLPAAPPPAVAATPQPDTGAPEPEPVASEPAPPPPEVSRPAPAPRRPARPTEERKVVTILVAGVTEETGGRLDPEDVRAHSQDSLDRIRERVQHYGGVVQAFVMGRLLAVFGAPRSHEDDPERAVRAALDVCEEASSTGQQIHVGVATGEVVMTLHDGTDADGPEQMRVAGDVVHAATGLAALAPAGGVVAGAGTYRATRRVISYRALRNASPLEQTTGSAAWQALAPRGRTGAEVADPKQSPLVERDRQLVLLTDLLERFLREREPQMITLVSDSGLGKSRLVAELGHLADQASELVTWRHGRSLPHEEGTFWALTEIIKSHTGILDNDSPALAADKLEQAVGHVLPDPEEAAWVTARLQVLLAPDRTLPAGEHKEEVLGAWARFLAAVATLRPLVVILEDLQWADDVLLEFTEELVDQVGSAPLLVVATGRPALLERRPGWGGGKRNAAAVSLAPLSPAGTARLLDTLLDGMELPGETREALIASSGGNPLYVEEYARMLRDREMPGSGAQLPIPESVQQLLAARLDALPQEEKVLLQDAAVVGEVFWPAPLVAMGDRKRAEVDAGLRQLARRQLLRRVRTSSVAGETEYLFRHALVRDVAYAQVLRGERADKHRKVASWIETLQPERVNDHIEQLAHHYSQALSLVRAVGQLDPTLTRRTREVLRAAGDRALWLGSYASAERSYTGALELWPERDLGRAEVLLGMARAKFYGAHTGEDELVQALDAFETAGAEDRVAAVEIEIERIIRMQGRGAEADARLERMLSRTTTPGPVRAQTLGNYAIDLMIADRCDEAIQVGSEAIRTAEGQGVPDAETMGLAAIGASKLKLGDPGGVDECTQAIAVAEQHQLPILHLARFTICWGLWWLGDLGRCATETTNWHGEAVAAHTATAGWFDGVQAGLDYVTGDWESATRRTNQVLADPTPDFAFPWHCVVRGRVRLASGDVAGALHDTGAGLAAVEQGGNDPRAWQFTLALHVRALVAAGRHDEADEQLDRLLAEQREHPRSSCATSDLAAAMIDLGRPATDFPEELPPAWWHLAVRDFARRDFGQALERFARMGSPADEALVRLYAARQAVADGQEATARAGLEQAVDFHRKVGATAYLREVEALTEDLGGAAG